MCGTRRMRMMPFSLVWLWSSVLSDALELRVVNLSADMPWLEITMKATPFLALGGVARAHACVISNLPTTVLSEAARHGAGSFKIKKNNPPNRARAREMIILNPFD